MFRKLRGLILRFKTSSNYTNDLDVILSEADFQAPLFDRLSWLVDLMQWVRYKSHLVDYKEVEDVTLPVVRLRFLLQVLERNADWKSQVSKTLRSILIDTRDVELFASTGLPDEQGFFSEFFHRLYVKVMPNRPLSEGGVQVFTALFPNHEDLEWFSALSPEVMQGLVDLILFERTPEESFEPILSDIEDALLILATQIRSIGLNHQVRRRSGKKVVKELPFFDLTLELEFLLSKLHSEDKTEFSAQAVKFKELLGECFNVFNEVYNHLNEYGVSLKVVYLLELAQGKIKRVNDLIDLLAESHVNPERLVYFISQLIKENQEQQGLWSLFEQNTRLISQKIVERSAETGDHYITRSRQEYREMFYKALGGGAYTAATVIVKVLIGLLHAPYFLQGFLYSVNYAISFVAIQLSGFTLATKQPAMTAPALASKLQKIRRGEPIDVIIDEIVRLIRSQMVGILGNVGMVAPCVVLLDLMYGLIFKHHIIMSPDKAHHLLTNSHLLSFAGLYAAFTGVLLWLSSIFAGYVDNWFHLNRMQDTIRFNRRLNYVIGKERSESVANFLNRNISGLSANISLGFFLGLIPEINKFFGLFLEVRHVTLSSGNLALGAMHYGVGVFKLWDFWLSVLGLVVIGFLNVGVSFSLAFLVALRSRNLQGAKRRQIYLSVLKRFKQAPLSFFIPPKDDSPLESAPH
jgi:site-specific recombinase